ncbi:(S)-N-methylcoclaurine 3'-hydroxylase isozyme 2 [Folsomia candida]|uniref:(S)-N-methylcoclaurine 3'-hydroxylase isozyme 2 n=1 Tax=Folsomia candida TaxID=158441 RepID=A0A226DGU4_FOLCA|nr:(S)-N-methylcoclaurine 3'-hydroxylase isozyme 2 [Folsomia candida]
MFVYYALAVIISLIIYYFLLKNDHSSKEPPGPKPWPIIGNLSDLAKASDNMTLSMGILAEKYGEIYSLKIGSKRTGAYEFLCMNKLPMSLQDDCSYLHEIVQMLFKTHMHALICMYVCMCIIVHTYFYANLYT